MKNCNACGASNLDSAKFCNECGTKLPITKPAAEVAKTVKSYAPEELAKTLKQRAATMAGKRKVDIMFVLDCTESMWREINGIKETIIEFAETIEKDGVRARVGMVEFRDRLYDEEHRVLTFGGDIFTDNPALFRQQVAKLEASGGGDAPESSLDAIMLALQQPFHPEGNKAIVLITDAPPHIPDKETKDIEEVVAAMKTAGVHQFYPVIRTQQRGSEVYLKLLSAGAKGMAFELGKGDDFQSRSDNFKRTLMSLGKTISTATR